MSSQGNKEAFGAGPDDDVSRLSRGILISIRLCITFTFEKFQNSSDYTLNTENTLFFSTEHQGAVGGDQPANRPFEEREDIREGFLEPLDHTPSSEEDDTANFPVFCYKCWIIH